MACKPWQSFRRPVQGTRPVWEPFPPANTWESSASYFDTGAAYHVI